MRSQLTITLKAHSEKSNATIKEPPKTKQYERAVFIGKQMKKDRTRRIDYKDLPILTTTRAGERIQYKPLMRRGSVIKEGGGAMYRAAEILADDIAKLLDAKSPR